MTVTSPRLTGKLLIDTAMGSFLGSKRIRLLEAIDKSGSISQAVKAGADFVVTSLPYTAPPKDVQVNFGRPA